MLALRDCFVLCRVKKIKLGVFAPNLSLNSQTLCINGPGSNINTHSYLWYSVASLSPLVGKSSSLFLEHRFLSAASKTGVTDVICEAHCSQQYSQVLHE